MSSEAPKKEKYSTFFDSTTVAAGSLIVIAALSFLAYILIFGKQG
ncbi:MAG TPA: hypothetical protein PLP27_00085 [Crocinitomicaceae bacterium]|nr:hypothetical protein [Crocinitomicaceae bacterium]